MNKESGRKIIAERVEEFEKNKAILTKKGHGETNIRSNYIDIMFKALGWNMKSHYEVVREFSQRDKSTDGGTKKVDYAFKINGKLKFFIEAKEASVDLEKDKSAIFQAKRYAYSSNGKAPIVILTDFEEFRVFNVIKAPLMDNTDRELLKSHTMRYTDYLEKWDLLWDTFSKEAVENGSLDKLRGKIDKNTKTMDVDFLEQITSWRELLAKNIAIRNENLNVDEINEAVQRILDRLVFIRNLEDREIEPENTLLDKTKKSDNIYKSLIPIFNSLNTTYNGLLFKKHFSEDIDVDDKTIHDIIRQMNYPVSPFQFDVIEPEILGRIYEKFLGSKIRLTDSHRAKIEEKIEVRKAGGVYYTPEYIVEYIVQNTVGKKIEGLSPEEIKKIKIVDPACGSGSFLIGAYSYLLDYHQKWYSTNKTDKNYKADWYKTKDGEIKVRLDKRSDILKNNIYGVDIDKEATEVSIMSLYLKMLDDGFDKGERDLFFQKGSVLPDMIENIKCGNSLIGTDYFKEKLNYSMDELKEIRPFDWKDEFPKILFDCVIGNPPYFNISTIPKHYFHYLESKYETIHTGYNDIMYYFIFKGIHLLNPSGILGLITSNYYLGNSYAKPLRLFLKDYIVKIVNFKDYLIFQDANIHTNVIIAHKNVKDNEIQYFELKDKDKFDQNSLDNSLDSFTLERNLLQDEWVITGSRNITIIDKIKNNTIQLGNISNIEKGSTSGKNKIFTVPYDFAELNNFEKELLRKNVKNGDIDKYIFNDRGNYLIYIDNDINIKKYPNIYKYLSDNKKTLKERNEVKRGLYHWSRLERPRNKSVFDSDEKLIVPYRADCNKFAYDNEKYFNDGGDIRAIVLNQECDFNIKYILGILNSTLMNWYYGFIGKPKGNMREYFNEPMALIPIHKLDLSIKDEKDYHDKMVNLVEQMISSKTEIKNIKSESDKRLYNQKIDLLSKNIDKLVYEIYNLTEEEIKIIESN